jgi:large subunit ribosomal protein L4
MSTVKVVDSTGKEQTSLDLGISVRDELSSKTYACAVRVLMQNWRQGTVACKSRSQVSFSNRKPWRQKGTGRARAGSARSPLWRKGGVTFGPQPRSRELKLNQKQKQLCLRNLLRVALDKGSIYCLDCDFSKEESPKTKRAHSILKNLGMTGKKGVLFLPYEDVSNVAAFRNIPTIGVLSFDQPNIFDLSGTEYWVFLKKDLDQFKDMVAKWI